MQGYKTNTSGSPRASLSLRRAAAIVAAGAAVFACTAPVFAAQHGAAATSSAVSKHTLRAPQASDLASGQASNDVTLDFVAADINDVLKALAVQTGANIVSSADVKGTITVSLAHVTLEQALDMVARLSGYQYAKMGDTYIVGTPSGIAAFASPSPATSGPQVTEVVALHYATVSDAVDAIKVQFPNIQCSAGEQISGADVGSSNNAIMLTGPQGEVDQAKGLVASLEQTLGARVAEETTDIYSVQYANIGDLINLVNTLVPAVIVTPGPAVGFRAVAPTAAAGAATSSSSGAGTTSTGASGGSGGSSSGGAGAAATGAITGPSTLLLTGMPVDIAKAEALLAKVDVKPAELLFETKVTEINDSDQKNIGLNWNFTNASTSIGEIGPTGTGAAQYPGQILKFGTFARSPISDLATVTLDALIQSGRAKLLADPNIAAIDGYPAQVFIGDTVNYIQSITTSTTGENITTASVQVGVTLRVTGKASPDGYITLNIHPEVSTISQYTPTPGGGELPDIATRYADTTVRVKDGQTIAIGGLIQNNDLDNISKVPFFGDLPFFGQFFRDSQHQLQKTEVVFFLKTSILKNS